MVGAMGDPDNTAIGTAEASSVISRRFMKKSVQIPVELTFLCKLCLLGLNNEVPTLATLATTLKRHIELKLPTSLGEYLRLNYDHKT